MTQEELLVKVAMDMEDVKRGLDNMDRRLHESGGHAEKTFLHAQSSARGFHRVLEQLNDSVPGLGTAFTAIANPITAAFTLAATGFALAQEKLKEFNKEMDRQGEEAAKPIWAREQIAKFKEEVADADKKYREFLKSLHPSLTTAEVESIAGEKDEVTRTHQARTAAKHIKAEQEAQMDEDKRLLAKQKELILEQNKLPAALEAAKSFAALVKGKDVTRTVKKIVPGAGPYPIDVEEIDPQASEDRQIKAGQRIKNIQARIIQNAEEMKRTEERRAEIERSTAEKTQAIRKLQEITTEGEMSTLEEGAYGIGPLRRGPGSGSYFLSRKEGGKTVMAEASEEFKKQALEFIGKFNSVIDAGTIKTSPKMGN